MPQSNGFEGEDLYVSGKDYKFDPPFVTVGFPIGVIRGEPKQLSFAEGRCVSYDTERQTHVFRGNPIDECLGTSAEKVKKYFFHVEIGGISSKVTLLEK
jgi:hypothetical protein